jgi:orotidine-5'-phosphate decarboxylase
MSIDKIIVPLDVQTQSEAIALIDLLPAVSWWKVGLELFVSAGPSICEELKKRGKNIFLDLKFHDIPNTVAGACRSAVKYEVDLLTLHATAGTQALTMAKSAVLAEAEKLGKKPPKLIAITLLTSLSARDLAFDLQVPIELPEYALKMALLAQSAGLDGAVCSPQEAAKLRDVCGKDYLLVCPGVRPSWAKTGDQSRTMTPVQALQAGASYLVIGRPITAAPNPAEALDKICQEILAG